MATFVWAAAVAGTWATGANWQVAGVPQAAPPTIADIAQFGTGTGATNVNCTTAAGDVCGELNIDDAYTATLTIGNSTSGLLIGDSTNGTLGAMRLGFNMTVTGAGNNSTIAFVSSGTNGGAGWSLTFHGGTSTAKYLVNATGGPFNIQNDWAVSRNDTNTFRVVAGTLNLGSAIGTVTGAASQFVVGASGTVTASGAAEIRIQGTNTATVWSMAGTATLSSATIVINSTSANTRTFAGGGGSYGILRYTIANSSGQLTVTGANTFGQIQFSDTTATRTLVLPAATTTTISGANGLGAIFGRSGANVSLQSASAGSAATVSLTSLVISVMRNVTVKDITCSPAGHLYALDGSSSTSGNTGVTFGGIAPGWGIST